MEEQITLTAGIVTVTLAGLDEARQTLERDSKMKQLFSEDCW